MAKSFIGLEIERTEQGVMFRQGSYAEKILKEYELSHFNPADTPLPSAADLSAQRESEQRFKADLHRKYQQLIAHFMYLAVSSRPDIMFVSSMLERQVHDPCKGHVGRGKRVLRYLWDTK